MLTRYSEILKSSSTESISWFSIYFIMVSSVIFPELATKYPRPQKCLPQNCFDMVLNSLIIFQLLFPFSSFTKSLTERCGGTDTNKWIWSFEMCPFIISTSILLQYCRISSRVRLANSPVKIFFLYFVIQTI